MKQNLSEAERKIRLGLGILISAIGAYALLFSWRLGLIVLGVGVFTTYEGYARWALAGALAEAWIRPEKDDEGAEP